MYFTVASISSYLYGEKNTHYKFVAKVFITQLKPVRVIHFVNDRVIKIVNLHFKDRIESVCCVVLHLIQFISIKNVNTVSYFASKIRVG